MKSKKLRPLSDFEWASAAQYIRYISSVAGLREINSNHVVSFRLSTVGPEKLLKKKKRVLVLLEGNKRGLERFVEEHRNELSENEMSILRTLYIQHKSGAETVMAHIEFIGECMVEVELTLERLAETGQETPLF